TAASHNQDDRRALALLRGALAEVDEKTDPVAAGELHVECVVCFAKLGDRQARDRAIDEALRLVPVEPATASRAKLLRGMAWRAWSVAQYAEAREIGEEALRVARLAGSRNEEGEALGPLVFASTFAGDIEAGLGYARQRRDLGESDGDPVGIAAGWLLVGFVLQADRRFADATNVFQEGAAFASAHGLERSWGSELEGWAAEALRRLGRWAESEALGRRVLERGRSTAAQAHELLALLLAGTGKLEEAEWHARAVWQACEGHLSFSQNLRYYPAVAEIALWRREFDHARSAVENGLELFAGSEDVRWVGELAVRGLRAEADLAEIARAERSPERLADAREHAASIMERLMNVARRVDEIGSVFAGESAAPVLLSRAELSRLEGASDPALWDMAAVAWLDIFQPYQAAYARYRQAEALLAAKAPRQDAAAVLREARETASRLGAAPLLAEIDALARRARLFIDTLATADVPEPGARDDDPFTAYGLTRREREVLGLLVDGSSDRQIANALFISDKTASVHVSNIKGKLGVSTRLEAATLANRLRAVEVR
ncbi:MAG: LuxR C-terminal-related transcriptional regulator, partial [Chloroflexota bacterium]